MAEVLQRQRNRTEEKMTVIVVRKSINFFRYAGAFIILSICFMFMFIEAVAHWCDDQLTKLAEKMAPG